MCVANLLQMLISVGKVTNCLRRGPWSAMSWKLPPLSTLRLFEAAARLSSFKIAAEDLHLTPSAVSHGVHALEAWLGAQLFTRTKRGISLTDAGTSYLPYVHDALAQISDGAARVAGRRLTGQLSISVCPTFAIRWLIPRLRTFRAKHPDIVVTVNTSQRCPEFPLNGVDVAIRLASAHRVNGTGFRLTRESLIPVLSPRLLNAAREIPLLEVLRTFPLIHVTTSSEDWAYWVEGAGIRDAVPLERGLHFDTIQLALEAAIQGLGLAIGRHPLADRDIASGTLTALNAPLVASTASYWLVGAELTFERPEEKFFRRWLTEEVQRDGTEDR